MNSNILEVDRATSAGSGEALGLKNPELIPMRDGVTSIRGNVRKAMGILN